MSEQRHSNLIRKLAEGGRLTRAEAEYISEKMLLRELDPVEIASVLTALKVRGETPQEIAGFVSTLRKYCVKIELEDTLRDRVIDTAGTGGDNAHTVNVSTVSAILAACCGAYVLKHGNRAMSSRSGSADFMEALGYNIELGPDQVKMLLKKTRFAFVFAQRYHPLLREVAPVRRKLGFRTIFNLAGPLSNPGLIRRQVLGVARLDLAPVMLEAMRELGYTRVIIVHGEPGIDEVSISGVTHVYELRGDKTEYYTIEAHELGLRQVPLSKLQVSGPNESVTAAVRALSPGADTPIRDFILANTAVALYCAEIVKDLRDGVELARGVIEDGSAMSYLKTIVELSRKLEAEV